MHLTQISGMLFDGKKKVVLYLLLQAKEMRNIPREVVASDRRFMSVQSSPVNQMNCHAAPFSQALKNVHISIGSHTSSSLSHYLASYSFSKSAKIFSPLARAASMSPTM
jgi:hypothetical protein